MNAQAKQARIRVLIQLYQIFNNELARATYGGGGWWLLSYTFLSLGRPQPQPATGLLSWRRSVALLLTHRTRLSQSFTHLKYYIG